MIMLGHSVHGSGLVPADLLELLEASFCRGQVVLQVILLELVSVHEIGVGLELTLDTLQLLILLCDAHFCVHKRFCSISKLLKRCLHSFTPFPFICLYHLVQRIQVVILSLQCVDLIVHWRDL